MAGNDYVRQPPAPLLPILGVSWRGYRGVGQGVEAWASPMDGVLCTWHTTARDCLQFCRHGCIPDGNVAQCEHSPGGGSSRHASEAVGSPPYRLRENITL